MSRTPSMHRFEAEAILGDAASFFITSENRSTVRKWATAIGIPSVKAYAMSNVELANLYHTNGRGATGETALPMIRTDIPLPSLPPVMPAPSVEQQNAAEQLVALIRGLGTSGPIDAEQVRGIVGEAVAAHRAEVADMIATAMVPQEVIHKIEVTTPAGTNVIVGRVHYMTETVIKVSSLGHHIMLVGPAGCGKTTIGDHVAKALGLSFYITSTVIDTHELTGFVDGYGNYHTTPFREAFQNGGVWIADEIDAWDAAALLTANAALANGVATFPDSATPIARHPNFRMIATANTFGHGADRVYIGRNELDAASLDRFATISIDYDLDLERNFAGGSVTAWLDRVWDVRKAVAEKNIRHVVSSRAIIMGSTALAAGIPQTMVEDMYLFKGMSKTDRAKIG